MDENQEPAWLIRDSHNRIHGPYKHSHILTQLKKGQLKGKTEIAAANAYWFAVEERAELAKFFPELNLGRGPESPTQMTSTLTEASIQDNTVEITQFTAITGRTDTKQTLDDENKNLASNTGQIQWLSEEFANEFGDSMDLSVQPQNTNTGHTDLTKTPTALTGSTPTGTNSGFTPTGGSQTPSGSDILSRATVKADTLPSEERNFKGDRPKPISNLMRGPERGGGIIASPKINVQVEPEPTPKMLSDRDDERTGRLRKKNMAWVGGGLIGAGLVAAAVVISMQYKTAAAPSRSKAPVYADPAAAMVALGRGILLSDLDTAKKALSDLDASPESKGNSAYFIAKALVQKEFMYDLEGAQGDLQQAKTRASNKRVEAEVDNLAAIYNFEHEPESSIEQLKRVSGEFPDDPVYQYNLALSALRLNHPADAIPIFEKLASAPAVDRVTLEDSLLGFGWAIQAMCGNKAKDPACKDSLVAAEGHYMSALEKNPFFDKGRLALGLVRLRHYGIGKSEKDFRDFLDSLPDLESESNLRNYRKMQNQDFYNFAHAQIVELNSPSPTMQKPSPLISAVDSVIAGLQNKTSEAEKILDVALTSAPGDINVLKAQGYLTWKKENYADLIDGFKDLRGTNSFSLNLLLGKASAKLGRNDQAAHFFQSLVDSFPTRSEGPALLGELLLQQGKVPDAIGHFNEALRRNPLDLAAWRGLEKAGSPVPITPDIAKFLPF